MKFVFSFDMIQLTNYCQKFLFLLMHEVSLGISLELRGNVCLRLTLNDTWGGSTLSDRGSLVQKAGAEDVEERAPKRKRN